MFRILGICISFSFICFGLVCCTSAERAKFGSFGSDHSVKCFSGGTVIYEGVMVSVDTAYSWTAQWANLITTTGYTELDNLMATYGFTISYYSSSTDVAILNTNQVINIYPLCDSIETFDGVICADPNIYFGDGNRINYNKIGD